MKCSRCNGLGYIEPSDGKRRPCSRCGGKGLEPRWGPPTALQLDRLTSGVPMPGYEFNFMLGTWAETDETRDARLASSEE